MKRFKYIMLACIIICSIGCQNKNSAIVPTDDVIVDNNYVTPVVKNDSNVQNEIKSSVNLTGIPKNQQYMWESDADYSDMPGKTNIKKIALYWYQEPAEDMPLYTLYECVEFSENEVIYQSGQTPGSEIVKYELTEEDKERYLNAIDYEIVEGKATGNGKWNVSLEFENGDCYVCHFSSDREAELLRTLFDKVEMTDYDISLAGF